APSAAHLPVEPSKQIDERVLDDVVKRRQGNLNPYQFSSASFDVTILTPVVIRGARQRTTARGFQSATQIVVTDFGEWADYFEDAPPVVVVRVTPKMAEGFWTTVGRAAASTQGVAIPP